MTAHPRSSRKEPSRSAWSTTIACAALTVKLGTNCAVAGDAANTSANAIPMIVSQVMALDRTNCLIAGTFLFRAPRACLTRRSEVDQWEKVGRSVEAATVDRRLALARNR